MIKINEIIKLKDGRKGRVVGQLQSGEYILSSGKGGQIVYFKEEDVSN